MEGLDTSRREARSTLRVLEYFSYLRDVKDEHNIKQDKIYNADETPLPVSNPVRYFIRPKGLNHSHTIRTDKYSV